MPIYFSWGNVKTTSKRRSKRNFKALRKRRTRAYMLFHNGNSQTEIAKRLGVSRQSVNRWFSYWNNFVKRGIKRVDRSGRKPKINERVSLELQRILKEGAQLQGFSTNHWTQKRVMLVIKRMSGIKYHYRHIGRLLNSLGWSYQKLPNRALKERNNRVMRWARHRYWSREKKELKYQAPIHEPESNNLSMSKDAFARLAKRRGLRIDL